MICGKEQGEMAITNQRGISRKGVSRVMGVLISGAVLIVREMSHCDK